MSDTQQEVIDRLIDMGYSKDVAEKMAKSLKGMKRQLASEDVVDKINNLVESTTIDYRRIALDMINIANEIAKEKEISTMLFSVGLKKHLALELEKNYKKVDVPEYDDTGDSWDDVIKPSWEWLLKNHMRGKYKGYSIISLRKRLKKRLDVGNNDSSKISNSMGRL